MPTVERAMSESAPPGMPPPAAVAAPQPEAEALARVKDTVAQLIKLVEELGVPGAAEHAEEVSAAQPEVAGPRTGSDVQAQQLQAHVGAPPSSPPNPEATVKPSDPDNQSEVDKPFPNMGWLLLGGGVLIGGAFLVSRYDQLLPIFGIVIVAYAIGLLVLLRRT